MPQEPPDLDSLIQNIRNAITEFDRAVRDEILRLRKEAADAARDDAIPPLPPYTPRERTLAKVAEAKAALVELDSNLADEMQHLAGEFDACRDALRAALSECDGWKAKFLTTTAAPIAAVPPLNPREDILVKVAEQLAEELNACRDALRKPGFFVDVARDARDGFAPPLPRETRRQHVFDGGVNARKFVEYCKAPDLTEDEARDLWKKWGWTWPDSARTLCALTESVPYTPREGTLVKISAAKASLAALETDLAAELQHLAGELDTCRAALGAALSERDDWKAKFLTPTASDSVWTDGVAQSGGSK